MKIYVGELEEYQSGTIISNSGDSIHFIFNESIETPMKFTLAFEKDDKIEARFGFKALGPLEALITCYNFQSSLGAGNPDLFSVGTLNGRNLFLSLRVFSFGNDGKMVHYSWLLGGES
jgi:hypothetical protein